MISNIKKALLVASVNFAIITLLYSLIMLLMESTDASMSALVIVLFFPFCLTISVADQFMESGKIQGLARSFIRFFAFLGSALIFIYLPHKEAMQGGYALIFFILIALGYALLRALGSAVFSKKDVPKNTSPEYKNVYKK